MFTFAKIDSESKVVEYPVTWDTLRARHSNALFPIPPKTEHVFQFGYVRVFDVAKPKADPGKRIVLAKEPLVKDGRYFKSFDQVELTSAEIAMIVVRMRKYRNQLLSASDWTQLADSPLSKTEKTKWAKYRQNLRDIIDTEKPWTVTFPSDPIVSDLNKGEK